MSQQRLFFINLSFIYVCIILCFFNLQIDITSAWVLTSNDGDITLLGPVLVEPSYGQEASVTLRRNSTSMFLTIWYTVKVSSSIVSL